MNNSRASLPVARLFIVTALTLSTSIVVQASDLVKFGLDNEGQVAVTIGGESAARYVFADKQISRPYLADLRAPGAPQATRTHPPLAGHDIDDHAEFHPGLWMSFGDISGNDYWRLAAATRHAQWLEKPHGGPDRGSYVVQNHYLSQRDGSVTCEEKCKHVFVVRPAGYLLLWDSTFASDKPFYFGDQEEMGLGIRMATSIRADANPQGEIPGGAGVMVDAAGRINGNEIWGNAADWCDYRGVRDGMRVGIAIFCHPDNFRLSWFHARDYGLLLANPFGRKAFGKGAESRVEVSPGEELRLRYGVLVHASPNGRAPDLQTEYANYLELTSK